jgi:hypothetical protein
LTGFGFGFSGSGSDAATFSTFAGSGAAGGGSTGRAVAGGGGGLGATVATAATFCGGSARGRSAFFDPDPTTRPVTSDASRAEAAHASAAFRNDTVFIVLKRAMTLVSSGIRAAGAGAAGTIGSGVDAAAAIAASRGLDDVADPGGGPCG